MGVVVFLVGVSAFLLMCAIYWFNFFSSSYREADDDLLEFLRGLIRGLKQLLDARNAILYILPFLVPLTGALVVDAAMKDGAYILGPLAWFWQFLLDSWQDPWATLVFYGVLVGIGPIFVPAIVLPFPLAMIGIPLWMSFGATNVCFVASSALATRLKLTPPPRGPDSFTGHYWNKEILYIPINLQFICASVFLLVGFWAMYG